MYKLVNSGKIFRCNACKMKHGITVSNMSKKWRIIFLTCKQHMRNATNISALLKRYTFR